MAEQSDTMKPADTVDRMTGRAREAEGVRGCHKHARGCIREAEGAGRHKYMYARGYAREAEGGVRLERSNAPSQPHSPRSTSPLNGWAQLGTP